jgi:hypothetical protein
MFPLTLLPLPGELIPLHIFEPRYKQLLQDIETLDIEFGIYCNHDLNKRQIGAIMRLESIIKRYPGGESDIIVRCIDIFTVEKLLRTYKAKTYPGGEVECWSITGNDRIGVELYELFLQYQKKRNINGHFNTFNLYQIATELNLDLFDRYKFLIASLKTKVSFLINQLKFQLHVLSQEEKSQNFFHLN